MSSRYNVGDKVIYTRDKYTSRPGPRAKNVLASPNGEAYQYQIDKFWVVTEIRSNATVVLRTRRGKEHLAQVDDPRLRKASLIERFWKSHLFPTLDSFHGQSPTISTQ